jgi:hypothetical protein
MAFTIKSRRAQENEDMKIPFSKLVESEHKAIDKAIEALRGPDNTEYGVWLKDYNKHVAESEKQKREANRAAAAQVAQKAAGAGTLKQK